jgi:replicative DNA helicase
MESTTFQSQNLENLLGDDLIKASLLAERTLLCCMSMGGDDIKLALSLVEDRDFYYPTYREIFLLYKMLDSREVQVTSETILLEMKDSPLRDVFREIITEGDVVASVRYYAKQVKSLAKRRELIRMAREVIINNSNVEHNIDESIESVSKVLASFTPEVAVGIRTASDVSTQVIEQIEKMRANPSGVTGIPTGFHAIDDKLSGLHKTDLIILAARPARGKSSFALQIAKNVALYAKTPVMFFSLEMGSDQLLQRVLASESRVPLNKMRSGDINDQEMTAIHAAKEVIAGMPLYFDDRGATSVKDIRKQIKSHNDTSNDKIGLVVIDYLQLMAIGGKENMVQAVTEISRGLKMLAREFDVPIIALSQLSRGVESRGGEPRLSDLRDSGSIEQDADIVAFLHSEKTEDNSYGEKHITFLVEKHRNGPTFKQELEFNGARMLFREVVSFDDF